jgi:hypothetical protein
VYADASDGNLGVAKTARAVVSRGKDFVVAGLLAAGHCAYAD